MVTKEQIIAAQNGDEKTIEFIINDIKPFIIERAQLYNQKHPYVEIDDLIQEGTLGLLHALKKFDTSTGYTLLTYGRWAIDSFMYDYVRYQKKRYTGLTVESDKDTAVADDLSVHYYGTSTSQFHNQVEEWYERKDLRRSVTAVLSGLPPQQKQILELKYGLKDGKIRSNVEVGQIMGSSKQNIFYLERQAFRRIKNTPALRKKLEPFV